ncbi:MAG: winged helix-turn-helix domain-containing protein [Candidatus Hodarchaeaceae archaeon]|nr:winged helix-turn-helix domain-containing protein [Candidatus Hodarchaeaceae archaeon]
MKKGERVLREILYRFHERNERFMSQKALAEACGLSLGTVNPIVRRLEQLGAIEKKPLGFRVSDVTRILLYWASKRNLAKDIVYSTSTSLSAANIEKDLPQGSVMTAYSGFNARFGEVPIDYQEVYVYADPAELKRRFPRARGRLNNLIVLKPDEHLIRLSEGGIAPLAQIYVDLWQLGDPAKKLVDELGARMRAGEIGALQGIIKRTRERPG